MALNNGLYPGVSIGPNHGLSVAPVWFRNWISLEFDAVLSIVLSVVLLAVLFGAALLVVFVFVLVLVVDVFTDIL